MQYLLQDDDGQILDTHSIAAGLDYPGVGPEHSFLRDIERAKYHVVRDDERRAEIEGLLAKRGAGGAPAIHVCNVESQQEIDDVAKAVGAKHGPIHGLVHSIAFANRSDDATAPMP